MGDQEDYSLVWQECGAGGEIATRFFVPDFKGTLPFFLSGQDLLIFQATGKIELREEQLLKGILYGLFELENDPKPWHRRENRETYLYLLDVLGRGFNFDDPEKLILDVASNLREKNGNNVSRIVLSSGLKLIPFSAKIRSDLVCDTWAVLSEDGPNEQLFETISEIVSETNLNDILPDAKEVLCYYGLCSLVLTGAEETEIGSFLEEYIYPNVQLGRLKVNIRNLLLDPSGYSPADLRVM